MEKAAEAAQMLTASHKGIVAGTDAQAPRAKIA
jgi:hypothetical protein